MNEVAGVIIEEANYLVSNTGLNLSTDVEARS